MGSNDNHMIRFSVGTGRNLGKATNKTLSLKSFLKQFEIPTRTKEKMRDYLRLPENDQKHLKSVAGWFYRTHIEGAVRNRGSGQPADMVTLDFDYATVEFLNDLRAGKVMPGWEWALHTSRRHTDEKPRFRMFIFLDTAVPNEFYAPVSRIIANHFDPDMRYVDKVSFRVAQMMFMPTSSADGDFVFHRNAGELVDWNAELDVFEATRGDWRDIANLPKVADEELRVSEEKAEDPTEKVGPVGDFCRAYSVQDAIEKFLSDKYEPVDITSGKPRYTYLGGTTTNGAEVQDDGLFLYSHHGSDPCADMLVNAFDLVRIHLFGDTDKGDDLKGVPITKHPSYKAMIDWAKNDEGFKRQQVASRYDMDAMMADFDDEDAGDVEYDAEAPVRVHKPEVIVNDEDDDYDPEIEALVGVPVDRNEAGAPVPRVDRVRRKRRGPPPKDWIQGLELATNGQVLTNAANVAQIMENDARLRNAIEYNEFTGKPVFREKLRTRLHFLPEFMPRDPISGSGFEDKHVNAMRVMLESQNGEGKVGYGLKSVAERDMHAALNLIALKNPFHPVKEYLEAQHTVDGLQCEELFIRFCGCPDTPYYREAGLKFMVAAVGRIYEPGLKFDFVPILSGGQGKRKSSFIAIFGKGWAGELKGDFGDEKRMVEQMIGRWTLELPELSSLTRSSIEEVKAFISGTGSNVRLAYERLPVDFSRQCVFIGSTNDEEYLIDRTGNRRWWPIPVKVDVIDTNKLAREIDHLWADALVHYRAMREAQPKGDLPLYLTSKEAQDESFKLQEAARVTTEADDYANMISDWLDKKVTPTGDDDFDPDAVGPQHRAYVTVAEVWTDALENNAKHTMSDARAVGHALRACGWTPKTRKIKGRPVKTFIPGPEVRRRWMREDSIAC